MRESLEFAVVWILVKLLGAMPRRWARAMGAGVGAVAYTILGRLRKVGLANLELAFPENPPLTASKSCADSIATSAGSSPNSARCRATRPRTTRSFLRYEGLEHYLAARDRGKGVLILTGHLGAWELSSYYHSLMGHPMSMVIRRLDNARVDQLVNDIRCLHGNRVLHKDDFARGLLAAMRQGETVGILMDTNMTPPQGAFVPFFGRLACTASGMARVALKTGATVLPGFMLWEESEQKYVLHFGEAIDLVSTGDDEQDVLENTARFTAVIESWIRRYPDQWLWVHRRWKTRPEGDPPVYR